MNQTTRYGDIELSKEEKKLTRSLNNDRSNKELLRTEINNATDPNVRLELTKMLLDIEKAEKKRKITRWSFIIVLILGFTFFLWHLGNKSTKETKPNQVSETQTSTSKETTSDTSTTQSTFSETNLTEAQVKEWVMSILDLLPPPPTRYILDMKTDDKDKLIYISVGIDQTDSLGTFRINAQGELEAKGAITGSLVDPNWTLMSKKYLDTSIAEEFFKEKNAKNSKINDTIQSARQMLIGKKYSIVPILYDEQDAAEAMEDRKAPQNLIHDGAQEITFIDDTTIRTELLGNYRPDYEDTYSINENKLMIRHNDIPYTLSNSGISFDTWTTEMDGHTVTWQMK